MSQQRRGLGKGLGALIPTGPIVDPASTASAPPLGLQPTAPGTPATGLRPVEGAYFQEIEVDSISPNPRQPREVFDEDRLDELAASIKEVGLLQPVVVRAVEDGRFELIMGSGGGAPRRSRGSTASPRSSGAPRTTKCSARR